MEGFGAGVDHADEEEGDWEPCERGVSGVVIIDKRFLGLTFLGFIRVEITVGDDSHRLCSLNSKDTDDRLRYVLATIPHPKLRQIPPPHLYD